MTMAGENTDERTAQTLRRRGYVHVYTGEGKGKTTAALGLAVRAAGHGRKVYIGQFLKGRAYGEHVELAAHPLITLEQFGSPECISRKEAGQEEHALRARQGLEHCSSALLLGEYDMVVFDEVDVAVDFALLSEEEVLELMAQRPQHVELVLTGRYASPRIMAKADLVTEMREVKHYYRNGVLARAGVEF